jgi:hypothetical protein
MATGAAALRRSEPIETRAPMTVVTPVEQPQVLHVEPLAPRAPRSAASSAETSEASRIAIARMKGYVGEACPECANFTLVRNGTCLKCDTCGSTTGCS